MYQNEIGKMSVYVYCNNIIMTKLQVNDERVRKRCECNVNYDYIKLAPHQATVYKNLACGITPLPHPYFNFYGAGYFNPLTVLCR